MPRRSSNTRRTPIIIDSCTDDELNIRVSKQKEAEKADAEEVRSFLIAGPFEEIPEPRRWMSKLGKLHPDDFSIFSVSRRMNIEDTFSAPTPSEGEPEPEEETRTTIETQDDTSARSPIDLDDPFVNNPPPPPPPIDNESHKDASEVESESDLTEYSASPPPDIPKNSPLVLISKPITQTKKKVNRSPIYVKMIINAVEIPSWPLTYNGGSMYIIEKEHLSRSLQLRPWKDIQYSCKRLSTPWLTHCSYLNKTVYRHEYKCTGIWHCDQIDPELLEKETDLLNESSNIFTRQERLRKSRDFSDPRQAALAFAYAIREDFEKKRACLKWIDGDYNEECCQMFQRVKGSNTVSGEDELNVLCSNHPKHGFGHFWRRVPARFNQFAKLIDYILTDGHVEEAAKPTCWNIRGNTCREKLCSQDHCFGNPAMVQRDCNVIMRWWISDKEILLTVHGEHTHPRHPPETKPTDAANAYIRAVRKYQATNLDGTAIGFIHSSAYASFCADFQGKTAADVHASFANKGWMYYVFHKQKLIHTPFGSGRLGLRYEWTTHHRDNPNRYIQYYFDNGINLMVICFYKEQVELLKSRNIGSIEIDMNYKAIDPYERCWAIHWAAWDYERNESGVIATVITNSQSAEMYSYMFEFTFPLFEQYGFQLHLQHLHGKGLLGLTLDQEWADFRGWGDFLVGRFPEFGLTWQQHHDASVRFCQVHYERRVVDLIGKNSPRGPGTLYDTMMQLLRITNNADFEETLDVITAHPEAPHKREKLETWAKHKRHPRIRSGLIQEFSQIEKEHWNRMSPHTNVVEVSHEAAYRHSGTYRPLVAVIQHNAIKDRWNVARQSVFAQFSMKVSYKNTSARGRWKAIYARTRTQKRKRANIYSSPPGNSISQPTKSPGTPSRQQQRSPIIVQQSPGGTMVKKQGTSVISPSRSPSARRRRTPAVSRAGSVSGGDSPRRKAAVNAQNVASDILVAEIDAEYKRAETRKLNADAEARELDNRLKRLQVEKLEQEAQSRN